MRVPASSAEQHEQEQSGGSGEQVRARTPKAVSGGRRLYSSEYVRQADVPIARAELSD